MSAVSLPPRRVADPKSFGRVAVLAGGWSAEREISLLTGAAVHKALAAQRIDAHLVDPNEDIARLLVEDGFDRAWIALHGRGGEDGTVQGALECLGIPYTGSGVLGSAMSMDKLRSKQIFSAAGLATPRFVQVEDPTSGAAVIGELGLPIAIKPSREGSSIGVTRVDTPEQFADAYARAAALDSCVIAESWLDVPEYTAGILQGVALPLIRIETPHEFYDYDAKYNADSTAYHCPCELDAALERVLAEQSLRAFEAVGARGWGRVDFLLANDNTPLFLEVNTVPGMTSHSLVPMAAAQAGCDFDELVWRILETSFIAGQSPGGGMH